MEAVVPHGAACEKVDTNSGGNLLFQPWCFDLTSKLALFLVRNTHVVVYKDGNKFDYRVLSVVKKYYNKWYMFRPSETPPALAPNSK